MWIMTEHGWRMIVPRHVIPPKHVPSLMEQLGIKPRPLHADGADQPTPEPAAG